MKKLVAGALALALGFSAFGQEAGVHELKSSAGKIQFGAWGRSTFNIGANNTSTKIDGTANVSDKLAKTTAAATIATNLNSTDTAVKMATATKYQAAAAAAQAAINQAISAGASADEIKAAGVLA